MTVGSELELNRPQELAAHLFDADAVRAVFQPIVDLVHGETVAFESLARFPESSYRPDQVFELARREGRATELDRNCLTAALRTASGRLPSGMRLFVNVEPSSAFAVGELLEGQDWISPDQIVVEITERALLADPAKLLGFVASLRRRGLSIALDDVGAVPESLALLPLIAPEVVKLDLSLLHRRPDREQARIITAVAAYAERHDAVVLAEGIETVRHRADALALGATLGQGWLFGRPGDSLAGATPTHPIDASPGGATDRVAVASSPFSVVEPERLRVASKGTLLGLSHHLEQQGTSLETPPVLLSTFQDASRYTAATRRRYLALARRCSLVVALGAGMPTDLGEGIRGAPIDLDDELAMQWVVAVVGVHYLGALVAKDLGDDGPDLERRFAFQLTHRPDLVMAVAHSLLARVTPI